MESRARVEFERALLYLRARMLAEALAPEIPEAEIISLTAWRAGGLGAGGKSGIGSEFLDHVEDLGD